MQNRDAIVLLPSYQPEETIIKLSEGLKNEGFKVLIVDDGSKGEYSHIFEACKPYADVIGYENNKGKGEALKTGFRHILDTLTEYSYVITADGDGQHRIQDIVRVYERISRVKMAVVGIRKFDVKIPFKSKIGNDLSKFTQALSTSTYMQDNQCGLRAFPISSLEDLIKIHGSRYEYEMNVLSSYQLKEIPYQEIYVQTIYENNNAGTHFRPILDTLLIQGSLLSVGIIGLLLFIFQGFSTWLLSKYAFPDVLLNLETSVVISFLAALILKIAIKCIAYRPKYAGKLILRTILYDLLVLIAIETSVVFFSRMLGLHVLLAYLICYVLILFPRFFIIKGVGIITNANVNGDFYE